MTRSISQLEAEAEQHGVMQKHYFHSVGGKRNSLSLPIV